MPTQLEVVRTASQLEEEQRRFRDTTDMSVNAVLCDLGGGIIHFADLALPSFERDRVLAQKFEREPEGRGPHFDVYSDYLDEEYPWLAILNLSGVAKLRAARLPSDLADVYFSRFPDPTDAAFDARRPISELALATPGTFIYEGQINPRSWLLLPQREKGPHIVHEVTPVNESNPGEFVKALVVRDDAETKEFLSSKGYVPLDELVSRSLGAKRDEPVAIRKPLTIPDPSPQRRSCNLD